MSDAPHALQFWSKFIHGKDMDGDPVALGYLQLSASDVVCINMKNEGSYVVAYNVGGDSAMVMLDDDKTTSERWKEGT
ncbi:hypothetical protein VNO77_42372 [Canavalia gladiata]|uniref:Uncharacterized protein n=1 Tax=Canavalia gladiata TaxID=3824 RepID=A0AAN9K2J7_CANGL